MRGDWGGKRRAHKLLQAFLLATSQSSRDFILKLIFYVQTLGRKDVSLSFIIEALEDEIKGDREREGIKLYLAYNLRAVLFLKRVVWGCVAYTDLGIGD